MCIWNDAQCNAQKGKFKLYLMWWLMRWLMVMQILPQISLVVLLFSSFWICSNTPDILGGPPVLLLLVSVQISSYQWGPHLLLYIKQSVENILPWHLYYFDIDLLLFLLTEINIWYNFTFLSSFFPLPI